MHTIVVALHIIGAGLMLGVVFFALVIVFPKVVDASRVSLLKTVLKFGTLGAIWQTITGLILYFGEADEFKNNPVFWIKMGLFVADGILALLIIDRKIKTAEAQNQSAGRRSQDEINLSGLPLWSLTSLVIILTIIILGVYL